MASKTLKSFQLGEALGAGTVGTIRRAVDKATRKEVALKILQPAVSHDPLIRQRFEREIEVLQKLSHPNIVNCYDYGIDDGRLFYSMEIVAGGDLKSVLQVREKLKVPEVLDIGWQLCSALQHVHNHGIIHRDLKPSNIYLALSGLAKLADFGIAFDSGETEITDQGLTVGSYMYMSPEQIRGERSVTSQTDLYALGCLLFELVCGEPPFTGTNFARIFDQHLESDPPSASDRVADCPPDLDDLIRLLLSKDPDQRPVNARAVQGVLGEIMMRQCGSQALSGLKDCHVNGSPRISRLIELPPIAVNEVSWRQLGLTAAIIVSLIFVAAMLRIVLS